MSETQTGNATSRVGIIDYGAGNLRSVHNALLALGVEPRVVREPAEMEGLEQLIFPGVGAFGDCVRNLKAQGLWQPVRDWLEADRPFLGICLGYQVLFEGSEESPGLEGLGFLKGQVVRFPRGTGLKVPHMGWNQVTLSDPGDPLWAGFPAEPYFYFVHSYYPAPEDETLISARADYGGPFAASIRRGNVVATQFHPERSQALGLLLLKNFLESSGGARSAKAQAKAGALSG